MPAQCKRKKQTKGGKHNSRTEATELGRNNLTEQRCVSSEDWKVRLILPRERKREGQEEESPDKCNPDIDDAT